MRTLLRQTSTGLFFEGPGKWTENPAAAFNFRSIDRLLGFIRQWNLRDVEPAFGFKDEPSAKTVPVERLATDYFQD